MESSLLADQFINPGQLDPAGAGGHHLKTVAGPKLRCTDCESGIVTW